MVVEPNVPEEGVNVSVDVYGPAAMVEYVYPVTAPIETLLVK